MRRRSVRGAVRYPDTAASGARRTATCSRRPPTSRIQVDIYYNFSHPKGSVRPSTCAGRQVEPVPAGGGRADRAPEDFHGSDCYYEEDQGFEEQVGHIVREIDDVPDGDWTIVVRRISS